MAPAGTGNSSVLKSSQGKGLRCIKPEDVIFEAEVLPDEQTVGPELLGNFVVNAKGSDIRVPEAEDTDATEYSSSFADTISGDDNCSGLSDTEVESQFYDDNGFASAFDEFIDVVPMRKKKLSSHWRRFISPLMWRCKWAELKIKQLRSVALKYDRQISALDRRKHMALDQYEVEGFGLSFQGHRDNAMKRRKRKRVEDTIDIKSYMSNHNLFSYIGNKRSDPDGTSIADDFCNPVLADQSTTGHGEFGIVDDQSFLEDKDNFLEEVFRKIEIVNSRVHKLKAQLELVRSKNGGIFSSSENLSHLVPCDVQTSSVRSPPFLACNGDTLLMGDLYDPLHHISEFDLDDLVIPEIEISSFGDMFDIPDIIESTVGLLGSLDVTQHQSQNGDFCEDIADTLLIHNQAAETETRTLIKCNNQQSRGTEKHHEAEKSGDEKSTSNAIIPALESAGPLDQSTKQTCLPMDFHFPKNKRKRGERKVGMGNWIRQCPGGESYSR